MSFDDGGDRNQQPTERRRREARMRGDVARSADLVAALVLLSGAVAFWFLSPPLVRELVTSMKSSLSSPPATTFDNGTAATQLTQLAERLSATVLPILLAIVVIAVGANLVQTGWLWVPSRIAQWQRISPSNAWNRWIGWDSWLGGLGSLVRLVIGLIVLAIFAHNRLASAGPLTQGSPQSILYLSSRLIGELSLILSVVLVVLAILDYGYRYWRHERQLMMTIEEVRREQRDDQSPRMTEPTYRIGGSSPRQEPL